MCSTPGNALCSGLGLDERKSGYAVVVGTAFACSGVVHMGLVPPLPLDMEGRGMEGIVMGAWRLRGSVASFFWVQVLGMGVESWVFARIWRGRTRERAGGCGRGLRKWGFWCGLWDGWPGRRGVRLGFRGGSWGGGGFGRCRSVWWVSLWGEGGDVDVITDDSSTMSSRSSAEGRLSLVGPDSPTVYICQVPRKARALASFWTSRSSSSC